MRKSNRLNILLVEILIATLFFALTSTVILKMYAATRAQSVSAGIGNSAMADLQNIADACYASDDPAAVLTEKGFAKEGDSYILSGEDYTLTADITEEKTAAGTLRAVTLSAYLDVEEEPIVTYPSVRYLPEVTAT